jgi:hypothetical protein
MSNVKALTFAIYKAEISANGGTSTPASWVEIPLTRQGTVEYSKSNAEVTDGEGSLFHIWYHSMRARVNLTTKLAFPRLMEMISGSPVSSAQGTDLIYFGREEELDPNKVRLRLHCKARDIDTASEGYAESIVFSAQGGLASFQMAETTPGEYAFEFTSLKSTYDANGNVVPSCYGSFRMVKSTTN